MVRSTGDIAGCLPGNFARHVGVDMIQCRGSPMRDSLRVVMQIVGLLVTQGAKVDGRTGLAPRTSQGVGFVPSFVDVEHGAVTGELETDRLRCCIADP